MTKPELIFVAGCNAAGKSTLIRSRLNELQGFKVLMTDVYKARTKELAQKAILNNESLIIETVFNDGSFSEIVDIARHAGYQTSLILLFLDSINQSIDRVAFRGIQRSGITISADNIKLNFNESFKNAAWYFFYFDRSEFIYTGVSGQNRLIMRFAKSTLLEYYSNDLIYPQKFAHYSYHKERLSKEAFNAIINNRDFTSHSNTRK
jgi:predicted ABC-type ATPase